MKNFLLFLIAISLGVALSSCYRHTVCPGYAKADQKIEMQKKGLEENKNL